MLTAERLSHDPALEPLVTSGDLKIVPARFNLATGAVTVLSAQP